MNAELIGNTQLEGQSTCCEFGDIDQCNINFGCGFRNILYFIHDIYRKNVNTGQADCDNMLVSYWTWYAQLPASRSVA
jgi:hypothetical protein